MRTALCRNGLGGCVSEGVQWIKGKRITRTIWPCCARRQACSPGRWHAHDYTPAAFAEIGRHGALQPLTAGRHLGRRHHRHVAHPGAGGPARRAGRARTAVAVEPARDVIVCTDFLDLVETMSHAWQEPRDDGGPGGQEVFDGSIDPNFGDRLNKEHCRVCRWSCRGSAS